MNEAFRELTSILNPKIEAIAGDTPLLIAMGAVGRASGIAIQKAPRKNSPEAIARASGFQVRRISLDAGWWQSDLGPLLGFVETETDTTPQNSDARPVALLPDKRGHRYQIFDPVSFKRIPVGYSTARSLSPHAYTFYRPFGDRPISPLDLLQFALRDRYGDMARVVLWGVLVSIAGMLVPQATAVLVDSVIPNGDRILLWQMGTGLLAAGFAATILQLTRDILTLRLQTAAGADVQAAIWDRLLKLEAAFFRQYPSGDIDNRASAIRQIYDRLNGAITTTLLSSLFSLLNLGLLFYYSSTLAGVALAIALVTVAVTVVAGLMTRRKFKALQELSGKILGLTVQTLNGISKLRVAAAEDRAFGVWAKNYAREMRLKLSTQQIEDFLALFNVAMPVISAIALFSFTVPLVASSRLSAGQFLAFYAAFGTFVGAATGLSNTLIDVLEIAVLWERAEPILQAVPETHNQGDDPGILSGALKLDRVSFRYSAESPWVLEDFTLEAQPGEFIGIAGPSGGGKSTIARLLLGFEKPTRGRVLYGDRDLERLDIGAVRAQLGTVLQNSRLTSGSIWEIIAGGAAITLDEAWEAARLAGIADEIAEMPMQMYTHISEAGGNLSGGQRQRLFIARALVRKPRILLFDEATSSLDNPTQAWVMQSLADLQITRVVVAHRQSTMERCDRIYRVG
ncbi:MAG: NHLP bacteriocin export ABC transporter permease/ATPase subunit [Cyanobacteria bacterium SBLK]|nr:NHLP bacteriocin export ABC transporter permease/ATPase subunit [Cyanobacteria bacterium SBLK]